MKKGFMQAAGDPHSVWQSIVELNEAGVDTRSITVGESFSDFVATLDRGDQVVVTRLEQISSSVSQLTELVCAMASRGAALRVLDNPWFEEVFPPDRKPSFDHVKGNKEKGRRPGRPPGNNVQIMNRCVDLYRSSQTSIRQICEQLGCSERTIYRYLRKSRQDCADGGALPHRPRGRKASYREKEHDPAL